MENNALNAEEIKADLKESINITILESTTSTNDVAKKLLRESAPTPLLIATNKQTAGRGRLGRSFYSEISHGLYFTLAFKPANDKLEDIPLYTILAAATLVETLEEMTDKTLAIKWVNDIFYNGRKISGILSELISADETSVIVGIGINLAGDFKQTTADTQQVAGTLFGQKTPKTFRQNGFLNVFIKRFTHYHRHFEERGFLRTYEKHLLGIGERVYYMKQNEKHYGTILGITDQGHLRIQQADGTLETLYSQEVHFSSAQFLNKF